MEVVITHCRQWPVVSDQSEFAAIKVLVELLHSIDEEQALFSHIQSSTHLTRGMRCIGYGRLVPSGRM